MDVLYKLGKATVADVLDQLPDERSYSTVRGQLRVLEQKRHARSAASHFPGSRRRTSPKVVGNLVYYFPKSSCHKNAAPPVPIPR